MRHEDEKEGESLQKGREHASNASNPAENHVLLSSSTTYWGQAGNRTTDNRPTQLENQKTQRNRNTRTTSLVENYVVNKNVGDRKTKMDETLRHTS